MTQGRTNWGGTLRKEVPGRNYSPTNKKQDENKLQWQDNFPNVIKQQKNGVTFCDGAAGSQVPQVVYDRNHYFSTDTVTNTETTFKRENLVTDSMRVSFHHKRAPKTKH